MFCDIQPSVGSHRTVLSSLELQLVIDWTSAGRLHIVKLFHAAFA